MSFLGNFASSSTLVSSRLNWSLYTKGGLEEARGGYKIARVRKNRFFLPNSARACRASSKFMAYFVTNLAQSLHLNSLFPNANNRLLPQRGQLITSISLHSAHIPPEC